jgi:hypothetical protein
LDYNVFNVFNDPSDNKSINIPITDGTYETGLIAERFREGVFIIIFFDIAGNIVTPTAGTIKAHMAPFKHPTKDQFQWLEPSSGDITINASSVIAGLALYTLPLFIGPSVKGRMILNGITGADHCQAFFWRTV